MPDCSFIKGISSKINGAANMTLPAKTKITPTNTEKVTIKILIFFEIFCVLAFANHDKAITKIIKIIIPKNSKFI